MTADDVSNPSSGNNQTTAVDDMSLLSITDGENDRGIPLVKFIDDVDAFANSFTPPSSAELLIGAYSELHSKFKTFETSLTQKKQNYDLKIPDIEKSLALVKNLQTKQEAGESVTTRYNLADNVYGKAEVDTSVGIVNLWLGANVMLEYTYQEAIDFLSQNLDSARKEFKIVKEDLAFVRDQIVTSEVSMTRIFNWDVRKKRAEGTVEASSS
mmetsp:Transcript_5729/g.14305  ORF Transcript_5729/g.14305 Transcript_5729/m.14305 type:complete len:212 (-) Transcript_5729:167-802(-)|eukprot:CAMPEP_0197174756 /NCGR_PEP_ID=MMETSP1423-20130617/1148_1 /TAXON_ID=476441 /ORGANISM="Pseudo-nitzschia heimii, Strain UNC1101" /LENGTH=211 /DNA_ID=CAMNT_0042623729 /DNA_START=54 /DNA_END=692 /DNA_ORIENTATION=-